MRVVFDTNVLVAGLRSRNGASFQLLNGIVEGENPFTLLLSVPLFLEYEAVLKRPAQLAVNGLTTQDIDTLLAILAARGYAVRIPFLWRPQLRDHQDEMVLEAAINGQAEAIITFNQKDFLKVTSQFGIVILSPSAFYA